MAPHSSIPAWKIPWTEEPGRLQSMRPLKVGHDWATSLSLFTFMHWRRKWQPTPVFLPGESQGQGSLVGGRLWVAQSWTRLKWLSSSSSVYLLIPNSLSSPTLFPIGNCKFVLLLPIFLFLFNYVDICKSVYVYILSIFCGINEYMYASEQINPF